MDTTVAAETRANRMRYAVLALFAASFGIEEAIIVLYLRLLPAHNGQINPDIYHLEIGREVCTLVVLAAAAAIAGARSDRRLRYFLFSFGVWDIIYYVGLWLFSGYPGFTSDDVLFLIPIPWVGPVWAVMSFAAALVLLGLFGIERRRVPVLLVGLLLGWLSFVYVPLGALLAGHGLDNRGAFQPGRYPVWLFAPAILCVLISSRIASKKPSPA